MNIWIRRAAVALALTVTIIVVVGLALGRRWSVTVKTTIAAPSAQIHGYIDDLRGWQRWAAWNAELDPTLTHRYAGPPRGVGASWSWHGPKMGRGRMVITKSDPQLGVFFDEAIESDSNNATGSITFAAVEGGTEVVWHDEGELPPILGGYFKRMVNEMLRGHFEVGLERLKALAEAGPAVTPAGDVAAPLAASATPSH